MHPWRALETSWWNIWLHETVNDFLYEYSQADLSTMMHFAGLLIWQCIWDRLTFRLICIETGRHFRSNSCDFWASVCWSSYVANVQNKVIWSCTAVCLWEGVLSVSFKHPSMHLIHFFTLSGSHIWSCEVNRGPSLAEGQPYGHQPEFGLSLHSKTPARHKMECCRKI